MLEGIQRTGRRCSRKAYYRGDEAAAAFEELPAARLALRPSASRRVPRRADLEERVVELLHLAETFGRLLSERDAFELPE